MTASKKRKKRKARIGAFIYWFFLIAFTVVLSLACAVALKDLDKYLTAYENSQPDEAIESYMTTLQTADFNTEIMNLASSVLHPFQTNEECQQLIRSRLGSNLTYQRKGGTGSSGTVYKLYCALDPSQGYYEIGSVTLKQDVSKAASVELGIFDNFVDKSTLCPWYVSDSSLDLSAFASTSSVIVTCPSTYSLFLNNNPVGTEYIAESGIQYTEFAEFYAEHPNLPTKCRYEINELIFGTLEPQLYDRNGQLVTIDEKSVTRNGNITEYVVDVMDYDPPTDSEKSALTAFTDSFISPFLSYFGTKNVNANAGPLRNLIVSGCAIDKRMTEFLDGATWIHYYSIQINSYNIVNMYSLGDGFYVVDVDYDAIAYGEYKNVEQASSVRIVVCDTGDGLKAVSAE